MTEKHDFKYSSNGSQVNEPVSNEHGLDALGLGFSTEHLLKLTQWRMPFGKYSGRALIELPEEYLFWFQKKGFPNGELGDLLKLCLELKIEGLDGLLRPLVSR
jgi:uncharacterized protein (DUF3820 family)